MSFRKRNVGLNASNSTARTTANQGDENMHSRLPASIVSNVHTIAPGLRPSSLDGRIVTSTGTPTLDNLLAGHGGLALGSLLLLEESGTTDFAGALLRFYAAEGIVQGHQVHVVGTDEHWGRQLPGLVGVADEGKGEKHKTEVPNERMRIAWRYERLGKFGAGNTRNRAQQQLPERGLPESITPGSASATFTPPAFCHLFDLTKQLVLPSPSTLNYHPIPPSHSQTPSFRSILQELTRQLSSHPSTTIHRLVIPILLSPATYPADAGSPRYLLTFLHSLRGLLRKCPTQLTAMMTIPLELYPRDAGIVRWAELLSDGVLEISPFPHTADSIDSQTPTGITSAQEEHPQGILKIHRLPVFHEKGGGGESSSGLGNELAFTVSRKKFTIKPYSLPPVEWDTDPQQAHVENADGTELKLDLDF
ncbi:MAG: hypothetical protein M1836_007672 [Candelina mexicana]|nr:MAG: hypothetical protein M1836_007672 [Candelina mexicana]